MLRRARCAALAAPRRPGYTRILTSLCVSESPRVYYTEETFRAGTTTVVFELGGAFFEVGRAFLRADSDSCKPGMEGFQ